MTTTLGFYRRYFLCLAIAASFFCGCGNTLQNAEKSDDGNVNTHNSTIDDPNWGTFELLAEGQNEESGKWDFVVRSSRAVIKNQLRFVWDFGNGPEGEGLEQSHSFTENGTYVITVTAYGADDSVAFVLKLTVEVGVDGNLAPVAIATAEESAIENELVFLFGGTSFDPDEDDITFKWDQTDGVPVQILHGNEASASFVAPMVDADEELRFRLTVSDGKLAGHSDVTVVVTDFLDPSDEGDPIDLDSDGDGTTDSEDGCPNDPAKVAAGECGCGEEETPDCPAQSDCFSSKATWQSGTISTQNGKFEVIFHATPKAEFIDAVMGLSAAPADRFSEMAVIVRFNPAGVIDFRNGGAYDADSEIPYTANVKYRFRLVVDAAAHTYDAFVKPDGVAEVTLATGYLFRTEQNAVSTLGNWNLWSDTEATLSMCNVRISAAQVSANAGSDLTISPGGSTPLSGTGSGGQAPYSYKWTPTTGLSNAFIPNPMASPAATTTYTLTVTDALGAIGTDTVEVAVRAPEALNANAGADKQMVTGGSAKLDGSATGGTEPYTYKWSPSTALSSTTVAAPTASPSANTTYTLTVTDSKGATDTDTVTVTVTSVGTAFIVAQGAANASDSNPGTEAAPWKTLAKAASTAKAGQTVLIKAGTYNETLRPTTSGGAGNLVTFKAYPGDACVQNSNYNILPTCKVKMTGVDTNGKSYIRIEGFEVTGSGINCQDRYTDTSKGLEIVNNYVHDNSGQAAIMVKNVDDTLVERNYMRNTPDAGINSRGTTVNLTIRGNVFLRIGTDAIRPGGKNTIIEDNILGDSFHTDGHQDGIEVYNGDDSVDGMIIRNNLIWDFTQNVYISGEDGPNPIKNISVLGNVIWCDGYCAGGGNAPGVNAGGNEGAIINLRIEGNTFYNVFNLITDDYADSSSAWMTGVVIQNNIFSDSGLEPDLRNSFTSDYNLFYRSGVHGRGSLASYRTGGGTRESHSMEADPKFINASNFDFHINSTSPAVNKGNSINGLTEDRDGNSRPMGGTFDIGAYEIR